jgi:HD-GYP domain-containing protein (c-di-GMP phosphodiesterase class II)
VPLRNAALLSQFDQREDHARIDLPELISALSFALDMTEGAMPGHALRSCILGMRIGERVGLTQGQMSGLYYTLLLKDIGCSSHASHMDQIVRGEDEAAQAETRAFVQAEVWADIRAEVKAALDLAQSPKIHAPRLSHLRSLWKPARTEEKPSEPVSKPLAFPRGSRRDAVRIHGDRGASIIAKIGLGTETAEAVRALDEHWDGTGYPGRMRGEQIPLLARIAAIAQHLDVFASGKGPEHAMLVLRERSGKWFDPELVRIAGSLHRTRTLWKDCLSILPEQDIRAAVLGLEPRENLYLGPEQIDRVCEAFSDVTDAKSPFTVDHSMGVTDAALVISDVLGLSPERTVFVRRAALLHDLGKLRIPNSILHKQGKLTVEEFLIVKEHPALTRKILGRIPAFRDMALVAGSHHEKLDGTGYPNNLSASQLSLEARVIAVADVYAALSETRPYRESLPLDKVTAIMRKEMPHKLDPEVFEALLSGLERQESESALRAG